MENIIIWLAIITSSFSIIATAFNSYKHFRDPDINASKRLALIEATCPMKHQALDDAVASLARNYELIKENHLRHIEGDISKVNEKLARMEGQFQTMVALVQEAIKKK